MNGDLLPRYYIKIEPQQDAHLRASFVASMYDKTGSAVRWLTSALRGSVRKWSDGQRLRAGPLGLFSWLPQHRPASGRLFRSHATMLGVASRIGRKAFWRASAPCREPQHDPVSPIGRIITPAASVSSRRPRWPARCTGCEDASAREAIDRSENAVLLDELGTIRHSPLTPDVARWPSSITSIT
jgi:hypothetical protein